MAFIKIGDSMKITSITGDDDVVMTCSACHEPLTTIVMDDENDGIKIACSCEYLEVEADNA